jgi:acyl carrier protein
MNNKEIEKELLKAIQKKTKKKVNLNSVLKDIGLDSLDMLDQVVEIENKMNIKIDDEALFEIKTIQDIINTINDALKKK